MADCCHAQQLFRMWNAGAACSSIAGCAMANCHRARTHTRLAAAPAVIMRPCLPPRPPDPFPTPPHPRQPSLLPPLPPHARYVFHENVCYDWGTFGWLLMGSGHVDPRRYRYFFFINSSVRGPFMPPYARVRAPRLARKCAAAPEAASSASRGGAWRQRGPAARPRPRVLAARGSSSGARALRPQQKLPRAHGLHACIPHASRRRRACCTGRSRSCRASTRR
jgi:hypothetical protein